MTLITDKWTVFDTEDSETTYRDHVLTKAGNRITFTPSWVEDVVYADEGQMAVAEVHSYVTFEDLGSVVGHNVTIHTYSDPYDGWKSHIDAKIEQYTSMGYTYEENTERRIDFDD